MKNKLQIEPVTLIVAMALTVLAVGLMNEYDPSWEKVLITLIFLFSGEATIMLYWSIILPLLQAELENSISPIKTNKKLRVLLVIIRFYCKIQLKILLFRCTIGEMKLFGYISGFIAFLIFYLVIPVKIVNLLINQYLLKILNNN